jgi:hypothetical protein
MGPEGGFQAWSSTSSDTTDAPLPDACAGAGRGGAQQRSCHVRHGCRPRRRPEAQASDGGVK